MLNIHESLSGSFFLFYFYFSCSHGFTTASAQCLRLSERFSIWFKSFPTLPIRFKIKMRSLQDAAIILVKVHTSGIDVLHCLTACLSVSALHWALPRGVSLAASIVLICVPSVRLSVMANKITRERTGSFFCKASSGSMCNVFLTKWVSNGFDFRTSEIVQTFLVQIW